MYTMNQLLMSKNGGYILSENNLYSIIEGKTYDLNDMSLERMLIFLKENSLFVHKKNISESINLTAMHRKMVYQICEVFDNDVKTSMIFEFEARFGNLITENTILFESWLSTLYDWTLGPLINRVKSYGAGAIKLVTDLFKGDIKAFMEDIREILFSPEGMVIEAVLTATGIGGFGPAIAWGLLALYDLYLITSGDPTASWFHFGIDVVCAGTAGAFTVMAKPFSSLLKSTGMISKTAGKNVAETIAIASKDSRLVKYINPLIEKMGQVGSKTSGIVKQAGEWASKNLKIKWLDNAINSFSSKVAEFMNSVGIKAGKEKLAKELINPNTGRRLSSAKNVAAANKRILTKGVKSGLGTGAVLGAIEGGASTETGRNAMYRLSSLFGANPYDDIIKAGQNGVNFEGKL